jgi:hypothetical protein
MARFRPQLSNAQPIATAPPDLVHVGQIIDELMQPVHFFVAPGLRLHWTMARAEELPWEFFQGRLLDANQTRQRRRFLSWHITEERAGEPLLAVRLDPNLATAYVTRGILCHAWEAYDAGGGVMLSREAQRWTRELVGAAELAQFPDTDELRDELVCLIWQAIVGTSRLPLHSIEAPLPAFSLGQLHYFYRPRAQDAGPIDSWQVLLDGTQHPSLSARERARLLEAVLRHIGLDDVPAVAAQFRERPDLAQQLMRIVFNEISLSPYTGFVPNALALVRSLGLPRSEYADFLARLLQQLGRHLTAYDLVTFHHRGANYPDALLLDAMLTDYLALIESAPDLFLGDDANSRLRRRALRQACVLRRHYEGHLVPDQPTSPGENARVLPSPHCRVAEEQLLQPHRRTRRLFADDALGNRLGLEARRVLRKSLLDLDCAAERSELGMGLFIDRPLGFARASAEPDQTPLLAHEAFSLSIARQRLQELVRLAGELPLDLPAEFIETVAEALQNAPVPGLAAHSLAEPARPAAALNDVRRVADDFMIVRTLPGGLRELMRLFDFGPLASVCSIHDPCWREGELPRVAAMIHTPRGPALGFFGDDYRCRLEAVADISAGFLCRAGVEVPRLGLRIVAVEGADAAHLGIRLPRK